MASKVTSWRSWIFGTEKMPSQSQFRIAVSTTDAEPRVTTTPSSQPSTTQCSSLSDAASLATPVSPALETRHRFRATAGPRGTPRLETVQRDQGIDGVGHFGRTIVAALEKRPEFRAQTRFFDSPRASAASTSATSRASATASRRRSTATAGVKRAFDARKNSGCRPADEFRAFFTARYPAGAALFRDHFECFATPPLDAWFGFDALPAADDPAWEGRAVAETYASLDRGAFAGGCGAAAGDARLAIHAARRPLATAGPAEGRRLRNALVVAATLAARLRAASTSVVAFARQLAAGGAVFRGLPAAPLNATSVDAGLDAFLARGPPGAPLRRA
ncbi:hypothetical protein JL720_12965 [Aureococcus anophagefferens]|nr:hypothetical protein JL720_12965 [Aureococcus anophagefferens]